MKQFLLKVISSGSGVSSKRTVGAITYIILTLSIIVLAFINPNFTGLCDILITLIITSASLLGITTFENIKKKSNKQEKTDET